MDEVRTHRIHAEAPTAPRSARPRDDQHEVTGQRAGVYQRVFDLKEHLEDRDGVGILGPEVTRNAVEQKLKQGASGLVVSDDVEARLWNRRATSGTASQYTREEKASVPP